MIKIKAGIKREAAGLRPLSEKEIQKKLYGSYFEETAKAEPETPVSTPVGEVNRKARVGVKKPLPGISFKPVSNFPWRKILNVSLEAGEALGGTIKRALGRIPIRWGAGAAVVAALFFGTFALNLYRTRSMKSSQVPALRPASSLTAGSSSAGVALPSPLADPDSETADPPAVLLPKPRRAPDAIRRRAPEPSRPTVRKPYVIQVATYANARDAEALSARLVQAGLPAFTQPSSRSSGKTFHLVFLGRYETFQEAEARFKAFRRQAVSGDFQDSFIRVL